MPPQAPRVSSLDLLKGIVIVIMALDHVRDYTHADATLYDPADPAKTTLVLYVTRWVTHFCAPVFSFLAGLSVYLASRKKTKGELSVFLFKRGLWLIFLELTILNFAWNFDIGFHTEQFAVIWSLGVSMIILAGLIHVPIQFIMAMSCVIIAGHNLLDSVHFDGNYWWAILHERTSLTIAPGYILFIDYPMIPWFAVMSLGYCVGTIYGPSFDTKTRRRVLWVTGLTCVGAFFLVRGLNIYGDPLPWSEYETIIQSAMSFMNPTKYPPSLSFLLMTLGPALILLALTENAKGRVVEFFSTFGRVPFFFYVLHVFLIHFTALILAELTGFGWRAMILIQWMENTSALRGYGFSLWVVFGVWMAIIAILYPLCRKFDRYKSGHKEKWWLSYL